MTDDLIIRPARPADLDAIVAMLAEDVIGHAPPDHPPAHYRAAFERIDADPGERLLVAELAGEVVGTCQLSFLPYLMWPVAQVEFVRVAGHLRGRRIGERMMGRTIELAREHGCARIQLTSNAARADAHRFYERLGFTASHVGMKLYLN